ncbi:MAG: type II secretion system secretin GspD [Candidatus Tectomicrobia bacterium]|nr:type II secretion system secretin GspD [Candidatus Tectomicrobia bacterium]
MRLHKLAVPGLLLACIAVLALVDRPHAARLDDEETLAGSPGAAAPAEGNKIQLNFRDVEILTVINLMSELTGKNFLIDGNVRGKVTLIAPQPVTIEEAYQVFLSILEIQGFTVVPQGPVIKVIPSADIKDSPIPTTTDDGALPAGAIDAFVTQLIPLQFADVNQIRGLVSPLVSKESSLLSYAPTNTLILTETASNIARLKTIISALDVKAPTKIFRVVPLQHAGADELAGALQTALQGLAETKSAADAPQTGDQAERRRRRRQRAAQATPGAEGPTILADTRTNSLILITSPSNMEVASDIIAELDIPTPSGRGQIHVYYLSHANAEELAQVLTAQAPEIAQMQDAAAEGQARQPSRPTTGRTPTNITITADQPTNSLVITADPETYAVIEDIIKKLDIRRSQVLVEGLIAEVSLGTARDLGVEWRLIDQPNGTQVFASATGSDGTGALNPLTADPTALLSTPGFLVGALRNTIRLDIGGSEQEILNIPLLLRAFQGNTNVEVLATPNLVTTDNEEAEIIVGEQRPFLTSVNRIPDAGIINVSNTFDFRDIGITLRITPQISKGNTVRTELFLEITRFVSEPEVGAVTTTKRSTSTTVIVDDGQTIVLGGLIQDAQNEGDTSVPCLGNIPLLGFAFRQTEVQSSKTNLLIFLTPHIIATHDDVERVTAHKKDQAYRPEAIEQKLLDGRPQDNLEWLLD